MSLPLCEKICVQIGASKIIMIANKLYLSRLASNILVCGAAKARSVLGMAKINS